MTGTTESTRRFKVALSFPGEHRSVVEHIADELAKEYGNDRILYDKYHKDEFARPSLDTYLQNLYRNESDLIVVFLCSEYQEKVWCSIEWRAVRDLMNQKDMEDRIMLIKCGEGQVDGVFGNDGYIDINNVPLPQIVIGIKSRAKILSHSTATATTNASPIVQSNIENRAISELPPHIKPTFELIQMNLLWYIEHRRRRQEYETKQVVEREHSNFSGVMYGVKQLLMLMYAATDEHERELLKKMIREMQEKVDKDGATP